MGYFILDQPKVSYNKSQENYDSLGLIFDIISVYCIHI